MTEYRNYACSRRLLLVFLYSIKKNLLTSRRMKDDLSNMSARRNKIQVSVENKCLFLPLLFFFFTLNIHIFFITYKIIKIIIQRGLDRPE